MKSICTVKEGNSLGLPCVPHVEGFGATEEGGVKVSSSPRGMGNSLSPCGKTKTGPCIPVLLMACCSLGCAGSILGWYEKYSQRRVSSSPHSSQPLSFCCEVPQAARALRRLEGEPALRDVRSESYSPLETHMPGFSGWLTQHQATALVGTMECHPGARLPHGIRSQDQLERL